jgi:hypothetical protein
VQALPLSHPEPFSLFVYSHCPVVALQMPDPSTWHWLGEAQITSVPDVQTPS